MFRGEIIHKQIITVRNISMSKNVLTIILMCIATLMFAQTIAPKKCSTCGKPLAQCQYKGKHPSTTRLENKEKDQNAPSAVSAPTGTHNGYGWVDLGLPSGTKWATMNVGANSPCDYGSYVAWGETSPKRRYLWENLKYWISGESIDNLSFTKYVIDIKYGNVDGKKELDLQDDAAYVTWGSGWRMPSKVQFEELREKCKWSWTTVGDHNGYKIVGPNGNSIFLPAAGTRYLSGLYGTKWDGKYWSRSLSLVGQWGAYTLVFGSGGSSIDYNSGRRDGNSVRAVLAP